MIHAVAFTLIGALFDRDERDEGDLRGDWPSSVGFALGFLLDAVLAGLQI